MLTKYIIKQLFFCIYSHKPISSAPVNQAMKMYKSVTGEGKKSIFRVIIELRRLSSYWHAWPDSYFRED